MTCGQTARTALTRTAVVCAWPGDTSEGPAPACAPSESRAPVPLQWTVGWRPGLAGAAAAAPVGRASPSSAGTCSGLPCLGAAARLTGSAASPASCRPAQVTGAQASSGPPGGTPAVGSHPRPTPGGCLCSPRDPRVQAPLRDSRRTAPSDVTASCFRKANQEDCPWPCPWPFSCLSGSGWVPNLECGN